MINADIVLLEEDEKSLVELTERILITIKRVELQVNANQMEYMMLQKRKILDHINAYISGSRHA